MNTKTKKMAKETILTTLGWVCLLIAVLILSSLKPAHAACTQASLQGQYYLDYNIRVKGVNYYNWGVINFDGRSDITFPATPISPAGTGFGGVSYSGTEAGIPATGGGVYIFNSLCKLSISMGVTPAGKTTHNEVAASSYGVMNGNTVISGGGEYWVVFKKGDKLYPAGGTFPGSFSLMKK
jgi:hypothetical protein